MLRIVIVLVLGAHGIGHLIGVAGPPGIVASDVDLPFRGLTAGGTMITGAVRVVDRHDDAYGTELLLAGLGAPVTAPIRPAAEISPPHQTS